jgi:endonuclease YncB( thermonuclease family)
VNKILIGLALALLATMQANTALADDPSYGNFPVDRATITEVYDGDTVFLDVPQWPAFAGKHIGVRIEGMDTPERHSHCADPLAKEKEEALSDKARTALLALLDSGEPIELRDMGRDKYFRILAQVWVGDTNVSDVLISKGLAVSYHGEKKAGWCTS